MKRSAERILVTHVGSLVRPQALQKHIVAKTSARESETSVDQFERTLKESVAGVVRQQKDCGIDIPSDGEFGKLGWISYVVERIGGLKFRPLRPDEPDEFDPQTEARDAERFRQFHEAYAPIRIYDWSASADGNFHLTAPPRRRTTWECTAPITYIGEKSIKRDIDNFKSALQGIDVADAFLPSAAPDSARGRIQSTYYESEDDFVMAIATAIRNEYRAITSAGFILQIDDAFLPTEYDRLLGKYPPEYVHKHAAKRIEMLNYALEGIPEERVRYHVCWGSYNVPHTSDVPLRTILDLVLKVRAQAYVIEAANPRHEHEWQIWEDAKLPDGKILIPGLISHATNIVEHPELVAWRIKNFARLVGRENVIAGTDCGFAQNWNAVRVHPSVQWAKLEFLAAGAELATRSLWH